MRLLHGSVNAVGFGLTAATGWLLSAAPEIRN
jgi:hypothetical protein